MYATSEYYADAIDNANLSYLTGLLTFQDGTTQRLDANNILMNGASITMQAVTGDVLEFGAAVLGELDIKIISTESRYKFFNATLELTYHLETLDGLEEVPLGVWTISEADRDKRYLKISAYDNMIKLDKDYVSSISGCAFDIMEELVEVCGLELAEKESYYKTLPNSEEFITINTESGCNTYRHAVGAVAQMLGCFVQADRNGKISMRRFQTEETFRLSMSQRYSSRIADYHCRYIQLQVDGLAGQFVSISETDETGLVMSMSDATAWDYGVEEVLQERTDNLRTYLETINYTPCEFSTFSNPAIDCGDRVILETDDGEVETIITSYTWNYQGKMEIQSVGKNPYLTGKSSKDQRMARTFTKSVETSKIIFYQFNNVKPVELGEEFKTATTVMFITTNKTSVTFNATLQVEVDVDDKEEKTVIRVLTPKIPESTNTSGTSTSTSGTTNTETPQIELEEVEYEIPYKRDGYAELGIQYYYNSVIMEPEYTQTLTKGSHIITLHYVIPEIPADSINYFEIKMNIVGGTALLDERMFRATISGQGLAGVSKWDGTITMHEEFDIVPIPDIKALNFNAEPDVRKVSRNDAHPITEQFGTVGVLNVSALGFSESVNAGMIITNYTFETPKKHMYTYDRNLVATNDNSFTIPTVFTYTAVEQPIDSGRMSVITVDATKYTSIEEIEVN